MLQRGGCLLALVLMGGTPSQNGGNFFMQIVPLLLIIPIFYLFLIRPQQNKQKEHQKMLTELKRGDRVVTSSATAAMNCGNSSGESAGAGASPVGARREFLRSSI